MHVECLKIFLLFFVLLYLSWCVINKYCMNNNDNKSLAGRSRNRMRCNVVNIIIMILREILAIKAMSDWSEGEREAAESWGRWDQHYRTSLSPQSPSTELRQGWGCAPARGRAWSAQRRQCPCWSNTRCGRWRRRCMSCRTPWRSSPCGRPVSCRQGG